MEFEDLFKTSIEIPIEMSESEFYEKTKKLMQIFDSSYSNAWINKPLADSEYPEESICSKCTGCGIFKKNDTELECIQDKIEGMCYYRYCDYEQLGINVETHLNSIYELLTVDKIKKDGNLQIS